MIDQGYFFFNDTATTEIYTLSLHDALPISRPPRSACRPSRRGRWRGSPPPWSHASLPRPEIPSARRWRRRSEEHTSELQSRQYLVCRLLLEKKKTTKHSGTDNIVYHPSSPP